MKYFIIIYFITSLAYGEDRTTFTHEERRGLPPELVPPNPVNQNPPDSKPTEEPSGDYANEPVDHSRGSVEKAKHRMISRGGGKQTGSRSSPMILDEKTLERINAPSEEYQFVSGDYAEAELKPIWHKLNDFKPIFSTSVKAKQIGMNALRASDQSHVEGDMKAAEFYKEIAIASADFALGLTPGVGLAKDVYESVFGYSLLSGNELSTTERMFALFGVVTLGYGDDVVKGLRLIEKIIEPIEGATKITTKVRSGMEVIHEVKVIKRAGEVLNDIERPKYPDFQEMWRKGDAVYEYSTLRPITARVLHGEDGDFSTFFMREDPMDLLKTMGAEDAKKYLRNQYAIPGANSMDYLSEFIIPTGTKVQIGKAAKNKFGDGGGIQLRPADGKLLKEWWVPEVIQFK